MKRRILLAALAIIGATAFAPFPMLQDSLLYFPQQVPLAAMTSPGLAAWPGAEDFHGLVAEPAGTARGTVIVFHGNAGHAGHREFYAQMLAPLGLRVILAEYPGYGPRGGAVGEASLVGDAVQTIALAHQRHGAPVLVIGESLGAGVAAAAARQARAQVAALMLITPWDRLESVASHHYAWLPVKWLLRDRYDSVTNLAGFERPVVVAVAEHDSIVPARYGIALHESLGSPKQLRTLRGAEHNDWIDRVDAAWWHEVVGFLLPAGTNSGNP